MRVLYFATDAYGGRGGIAQVNRDWAEALDTDPEISEIVLLPRRIQDRVGTIPSKVSVRTGAASGKMAYVTETVRALLSDRRFDLIICAHINLLPIANVARIFTGAPVILIIHGIDAWEPPSRAARKALRRVDLVVSVSRFTRDRFLAWSDFRGRVDVVPNAIHLDRFEPGPRDESLADRLGLANRRVLMSMGRLDSRERYKGVDEILEILPALASSIPDIAYLICGDGDDRFRLEAKVTRLGLTDRLVFTRYVPENEKVAHYRLADLFLLAGKGEGFGIVLLEALACGIPVIGSTLDGTRDALLDGKLGRLVDPTEPEALQTAIEELLASHQSVDRETLTQFGFDAFVRRIRELTRSIVSR